MEKCRFTNIGESAAYSSNEKFSKLKMKTVSKASFLKSGAL